MMQPFRPRPIQFRDVISHTAWRLKRYAICASGDVGADWPEFAPGRALALGMLPTPAQTAERPGVGFLVEHRGAGVDYLVLAWWDRENELPVRVVVREQTAESAWRAAGASESFCVWDLEVMAFERDAYVATILAPQAGNDAIDAYLARRLNRIP